MAEPHETQPADIALTSTMPRGLFQRLSTFCATMNEPIGDVVCDAIALHLDELEGAPIELLPLLAEER